MRRDSEVLTGIFEHQQYAGPATTHLAHRLSLRFVAARTIPVELHQNLALLVDDQCLFAMLQAVPQELFDDIVNEASICTKPKASSVGSSNAGTDVTTNPLSTSQTSREATRPSCVGAVKEPLFQFPLSSDIFSDEELLPSSYPSRS